MNQGLGPVVGNRFDDARKTALKPHLMERLVALTVRAVPLGTMVTEDDGRMAFVPNYTHTTERAVPKARPAEGDDERAVMVGFDPMKSPLQLGDYVEVVSVGFEYGFRGKVASINSRGGFHVHYDGRAEPEQAPWGNRSSLKLLARKANG